MARYLLLGTVLTAITLFVWQSLSNAVIPWHSAPMQRITPAQVQALHATLPGNGLYGANEGMLVVMNTTPDLRDRTSAMGLPLARQILIDLLAAAILAWAVTRLPRRRALATAGTLALIAGAFGIIVALSNWNWYGFPVAFELANLTDTAIQGFLAGLLLSWALRRFGAEAAPATEPAMAMR